MQQNRLAWLAGMVTVFCAAEPDAARAGTPYYSWYEGRLQCDKKTDCFLIEDPDTLSHGTVRLTRVGKGTRFRDLSLQGTFVKVLGHRDRNELEVQTLEPSAPVPNMMKGLAP